MKRRKGITTRETRLLKGIEEVEQISRSLEYTAQYQNPVLQ